MYLFVEVIFHAGQRRNLPKTGYRPDAIFNKLGDYWGITFTELQVDKFDNPTLAIIKFTFQDCHYREVCLYDSFLLCRNSIRKDLSHIAHKRRNARFNGLWWVNTPPQPLTAHTAAHTPKHGGLSGSMVTMFPATGSSTPSTLFRQIRRSPLLLRKDTVMPFLLRASTLLRIRWEKLLGVSPSAPAGSIFSNSTLAGALISGCRRSSSERRKRILSLGCSVCSQSSDSSFQT